MDKSPAAGGLYEITTRDHEDHFEVLMNGFPSLNLTAFPPYSLSWFYAIVMLPLVGCQTQRPTLLGLYSS